MRNFIIFFSLFIVTNVGAQSVGIGTINPNSSAILDITSTNKGLLLPRMNTTERNAIVAPALGLKILNTDDMCEDIYDGSKWSKDCGLNNNATINLPAGNFIPKADFPGGERQGAASFVIGNTIYVGIGKRTLSDTTIRKDFWAYNTQTNQWSRIADFGGGFRYRAVAFAINGRGYIATGWDGTMRKKDLWEYNPTTNTWTQKADFPGEARHSAVGFEIAGLGYLGTGESDTAYKNDFWEYNPSTNVWTQKSNFNGTPRAEAIAFTINGKGYIGLGFDGIETVDFYEYTPNGTGLGTWLQKLNFAGGSSKNSIGIGMGSKGYVCMGSQGNVLWAYEPTTNAWVQATTTLYPGDKTVLPFGNAVGTNLYFGTGYLSGVLPMRKDVWMYNTQAIQGNEYKDALPSDGLKFTSPSWTSQGTILYTTIDGVDATVKGNLFSNAISTYKASIINHSNVLIEGNTIQARINKSSTSFTNLILQENGGNVVIGDAIGTNSIQIMGNGNSLSGLATFGNTSGNNLFFNGNSIYARNNGSPSTMNLQSNGGLLNVGGAISVNGNSTLNGNIGIGTSPSTGSISLKLDGGTDASLTSTAGYMTIGPLSGSNLVLDNNEIIARNNGANTKLFVQATGGDFETGGVAFKPGGGSWTAASDRRLKSNIVPYNDGLDMLLKIDPVQFHYNALTKFDTSKSYIGVIAQDLKEVAPYMVSNYDGLHGDYLCVDNSAMTYMLINATKSLHSENQLLKSEMEILKTKNEILSKQLALIEASILEIRQTINLTADRSNH